jgi:hypothetical protein
MALRPRPPAAPPLTTPGAKASKRGQFYFAENRTFLLCVDRYNTRSTIPIGSAAVGSQMGNWPKSSTCGLFGAPPPDSIQKPRG